MSICKGVMMVLAVLGGEKTNPIQSQFKACPERIRMGQSRLAPRPALGG